MNAQLKSAVMKMATISIVAVSVGSLGCGGKVNPTDPDLAKSSEGLACNGPDGLIDDGEDGNNQTFVTANRGGYWYTFCDDVGTQIWPTAGAQGGTFEMSPGGADNTGFAARFKGQVAAAAPGVNVFAGAGMNFLDPKDPYDTSKYQGIQFWAKKGPGSVGKVRLKLPDVYTDPDGGHCTECFNDLGIDLTLTEEWQLFTVPFYGVKQEKYWGKPKRGSIEQTGMYGIQFQVKEPGATYDISIDQLRFTGCK